MLIRQGLPAARLGSWERDLASNRVTWSEHIHEIFGRTPERRMERQLIVDYFALIDEIVATLTPDNHRIAVALAAIPEHIRGYGHVKEAHLKTAKAREAELLAQYRAPSPAPLAQAAE